MLLILTLRTYDDIFAHHIMVAILASLHMQTADDLFGGPQGSSRTDKLIDASIHWAEWIMRRIDSVGP
jgi:hypothetical protein